MSFGRWLLVHSFSIFILALFIFGYIYRTELQLESAYQQLLNIDPKAVVSSPPGQEPSVEKIEKSEPAVAIKKAELKTDLAESNINEETVNISPIETVPTVLIPQNRVDEDVKLSEQLLSARQAYWDKKYADAIYSYRQLIQQDRHNPDYYGELGNIYYSLNDNKNASRLYYQAAQEFLRQNKPEKAGSLLAPITAMNRELGDKLEFQLR